MKGTRFFVRRSLRRKPVETPSLGASCSSVSSSEARTSLASSMAPSPNTGCHRRAGAFSYLHTLFRLTVCAFRFAFRFEVLGAQFLYGIRCQLPAAQSKHFRGALEGRWAVRWVRFLAASDGET